MNKMITSYLQIRYWPKKDNIMYDPQALHYLSRTTRPWALIRGLQPNTYYYVQVMAYNAAGPGPASEAQFGMCGLTKIIWIMYSNSILIVTS